MKKILISLTMSTLLVACSEPEPQAGEYFDQITPVPGSLDAQPIPPTAEIPSQPISAPQVNVDADGIEYETVTVDVSSVEPAASPSNGSAAPAPGLYEPALSIPEEDAKAKKKAAKPPTVISILCRKSPKSHS